jgi:hypothetical protein
MGMLTEKERYIILAYANCGCLNIVSKKAKMVEQEGDAEAGDEPVVYRQLPDEERERICESLSITDNYLRQLKKRALEKLLRHLNGQ